MVRSINKNIKKACLFITICLLAGCTRTYDDPVGPVLWTQPDGNKLNNYVIDRTSVHYTFTGVGNLEDFSGLEDCWVSFWSALDQLNKSGANGFWHNPSGQYLEFGYTNIRSDADGWFWN